MTALALAFIGFGLRQLVVVICQLWCRFLTHSLVGLQLVLVSLENNMLICWFTVGSSGAILFTSCKAMNRLIINVLFGGAMGGAAVAACKRQANKFNVTIVLVRQMMQAS